MASALQHVQQHGPIHLLSKKSKRLDRDTFFFWPLSGLLGGLNQKLTPVTPATLYRWLKLCDPNCSKFELYETRVKKWSILRYACEPLGPAIPWTESTNPLPCGDFLLDIKESEKTHDPFEEHPMDSLWRKEKTFAEMKAMAQDPETFLAERLHFYDFPKGLEGLVRRRDGGRCVITGSDIDVGVSWVFPPAWYHRFQSEKYAQSPDALSISFNMILMKKDLMEAFHDNSFGVDVDDDYRIIVFRDLGSAKDSLMHLRNEPAFLSHHPRASPAILFDDAFLRLHFRHCLLVHFVGGDIFEDYSLHDIQDVMEALGIDVDDVDEIAPMDDPLWQTPLGREIIEDHMRSSLFMADADVSDASDSEIVEDSS